jgi:hypothetical protein
MVDQNVPLHCLESPSPERAIQNLAVDASIVRDVESSAVRRIQVRRPSKQPKSMGS